MYLQDDGDKDGKERRGGGVNVPVECGQGCRELKVWQDRKPQGFVKCTDNQDPEMGPSSEVGGMEESLTYFLSRNSTICE